MTGSGSHAIVLEVLVGGKRAGSRTQPSAKRPRPSMPSDGKNLEALVALIEKLHLPEVLNHDEQARLRRWCSSRRMDVIVEGRLPVRLT